MRRMGPLTVAFGTLIAATVGAQGVQPVKTRGRGGGHAPCVGSDGGFYQCPPPPRVAAVRAGRLFDSLTGALLTRQEILLQGDRITAVGPEAHLTIPAGAQVVDLSRATVPPGLNDAHTHIFNTPRSRTATDAAV